MLKIQGTQKNPSTESKREQSQNRDQRLLQSEGMHAVAPNGKGKRYLKGNDQEKKNLQKYYTLHPKADENINGVLASGVFNEGLHSDLLIQVTAALVSYRCEASPGKLTHADGLKHCCVGTQS